MGYVRPENEDGLEISHSGDMRRSGEENLANGLLQAAAPEMAETLLTIHQSGMFHGPDQCEIGALLKKAGVLRQRAKQKVHEASVVKQQLKIRLMDRSNIVSSRDEEKRGKQ